MNVVDVPGGSGVTGQDAAAAATPKGMTVGYMNVFFDADAVLTNSPGVNFNPQKVDMLMGNPSANYTLVASPGSVFTTDKSLLTASSISNPVKWMIAGPTGDLAVTMRLMSQAFDLPTAYLNAYSGQAAVETGFLRGDAPLWFGPDTSIGPLVQQGKAVPLVNLTAIPTSSPYYGVLHNAPTLQQMISTDGSKKPTRLEKEAMAGLEALIPVGGVFFFFTQTATPAARVTALRAAFKFAMKQPAVDSEFIASAQPDKYLAGPNGKVVYDNALKALKKVIPALG